MLKFFRKIRQSLLKDGNIKQYLLYAIGEILLVMIGILLALQVNNWNEYNKTEATEQAYLLALQTEFETNLKELDNFVALNQRLMQATKEFLKYTSPNATKISLDTMAKLQWNVVASNVEYEPSPGILEDLINSGNLRKITNNTLREQLSLWKAKLASVRKQETTINEHRTGIKKIMVAGGNMRKQVANALEIDTGNFANNSKALLQNIELENYLIFFLLTSGSLDVYYYKNLREVNVQILESIQQEIIQ